MEAARSFETLVTVYRSKRHHIPEKISRLGQSREREKYAHGSCRAKNFAGEDQQQITIPCYTMHTRRQ
jgi:hypothetical protein